MVIRIEDDFDLERIAGSGQCFRWEKQEGDAWRIPARGECLYISRLDGDRYELDCGEAAFDGFWRDYFDLGEDYRSIRRRIDPERDPFLWEASEREKGIRILRQDPWEMLVTFIISQNRNIPGIRRSVELLAQTCGERRQDRRGKPYFAFPEAEAVAALSAGELEQCRLGYRCRYVQETARAAAEGRIDLQALCAADDRTALESLCSLTGVGIKVASCVALFGLHHTDSFPVDVWMRRVLEEHYPGGYPYERYSPYNGVCQQYMFAFMRNSGRGKQTKKT